MGMREKIDNFMRLFVLLSTMIMGFFFVYAVIWFAVGLPQTNWALALLMALAVLSEYGYYLWIRE